MLGSLFTSTASSARGGRPVGSGRPRLPTAVSVTLALVLALSFLYPEAMWQGKVFLSSDASNEDAFGIVGDAGRATGSYPLWNPYLFCGMPTFGSLAYVKGVYPPSVLFNFLQNELSFPPLSWLLVHLLFGGLGMAYLLSRWRLPTAALVLGALVWILAPKVVAWGVHGHGSKLGAAMYLPWIVAASWRVLQGRGARAVALTALLLGLQFLRGHFQISYYSLLVVGYLALAVTVAAIDSSLPAVVPVIRWRRLLWLAGGVVLALLIGAVLLLPVHSYAPLSVRGAAESGGAAYGYATGWSLAPAEWATLVFPSVAGFGKATYAGFMPFNDYPNYLGLLLLLLAVVSWWAGQRRLVLAMALLGSLALLVACGRHAPFLYDLCYHYLPFFNKFRIPSMIVILLVFSVAILASFGATVLSRSDFLERRLGHRLPWLIGGGGLLLLLLGGLGLARTGFEDQLQKLAASAGKPTAPLLLARAWDLHRADLIRIGLILMVAGSALFYSTRKRTFRELGLIWTLAVLVMVDMLGVDRRIVHPETSLVEVVADTAGQAQLVPAGQLVRSYRARQEAAGRSREHADLAAQVGHDRLWPLGPEYDGRNSLMTQHIRSLDGYHPAKLAAYEQVRRKLRLQNTRRPAGRVASWLGGRVVSLGGELEPAEIEFVRQLGVELDPVPFRSGGQLFYRNRSALPRARLMSRYRLVESLPGGDDLDSFLDGVQNGQIAVDSLVVLDRVPEPAPLPAAGQLPAPEFLSDGLNEVVLGTSAPVPALLLLADMTIPGWSVTVDGQAAELLRADLILRAVALPAGEHEVRFVYRDPAVRQGLLLSLLGVTVLLLLGILPRWVPALRGMSNPGREVD